LTAQPDIDRLELRALDFFRDVTVPEIQGESYTRIWHNYILPMAHNEPALKHAVVALGSLHEEYLENPDFPANRYCNYPFRHYGKAISLVMKLDASSRNAVDVALASCVMFAAIETLKGHPRSSMTHVLSGMRILQQQDLCHTEGFVPRHLLERLFCHLSCQAMQMGDISTILQTSALANLVIPQKFNSTQEAITSLEAFQYYTLHRYQDSALMLDATMPTQEREARLAAVGEMNRDLSNKWITACEDFLYWNERADGPPHLILRLMIEATLIQLHSPQECDFDRFTNNFNNMIDLADKYLRATASATKYELPRPPPRTPERQSPSSFSSSSPVLTPTTPATPPPAGAAEDKADCPARELRPKLPPSGSASTRPRFTMSSGVVSHLYMVAASCRDPTIRRRALQLLQTSHRREGLWDSQITATVAEKVMLLEEHNARRLLGLDVDQPLMDSSQIPIQARYTVTGLQFGQNREGFVKYTSRDPSSPLVEVTEKLRW
jgi:hypothetical protein